MATEKRIRVPVLDASTIGNCTMALTLDTTHKSASGRYHLCLRFAMNGKRYYYRLGEKYTSAEFDLEKHCIKMNGFKFNPQANGFRLPTESEWVFPRSPS